MNRRARRAKTDRLDGDKLLAMLICYHGGERRVWAVARVPTPEQETAPEHGNRAAGRERTAHINRIRALSVLQNLRVKYVGGRLCSAGGAATREALPGWCRDRARARGRRSCGGRCAGWRPSSARRGRATPKRRSCGLRSCARSG